MKSIVSLLSLFALLQINAQTTINPNTGDAYLLFGPNTNWGEYFQVGGNGRVTNNAGVFTTNGNLHLDSKNNSFKTYINHYSKGNTILNSQGGRVGIGTTNPSDLLHLNSDANSYLRIHTESPTSNSGIKFTGKRDSGIDSNHFIGTDGTNNYNLAMVVDESLFIKTNNSTRLTVHANGNVGIGTASPDEKFHLEGDLLLDAYSLGTESGLFFREGFSDGNKYNLSILTYNDGDNTSDALAINAYDGVYFNTGSNSKNTRMLIHQNGNVGIGTSSPDAELAVNGNIHAKEVKVDLIGWPDYVFKTNYDLPSLEEVERHIKEKGHLINIPSAKEVAKNGVQLGEMNKLLLEKIEELTLYTLKQEQKIQELENLKSKTALFQKELEQLKRQINLLNSKSDEK